MFFIPVAIGDNHKSQMPSVGGERITNALGSGGDGITNALGSPERITKTTTKRQLESQSPHHLIWGLATILSSWEVDVVVENNFRFEFLLEFKLE